jgi:hypothetical protein
MFGGCLIASRAGLPFAGTVVVLNRRLSKRSSRSSVLALPVSLPPKLRVTSAERENMPLYLRALFRVLSSWVHEPNSPAPNGGTGSSGRASKGRT